MTSCSQAATERRPWYWLEQTGRSAAENMAVDECLLEAVGQFGAPVLRFYNWSEPAATFGYFQKYLEIERLTPLRPLVRRPTGGGLVPHEADWTYSLAFPVGHPWYALTARESYQRVHAWIQAAFARIGCATEMAARARHERPGQCFAGGAEQFDLLWEGGKIAGAAQRRTKQGLLIQGSIQRLPGMPARAAWQQACRAVAVEQWGVKWAELSWDSSLENRVRELVEKKYGRAEYNQRR